TTVGSGGTEVVLSGGTDRGATVGVSGTLDMTDHGSGIGETISGASAVASITDFGHITSALVVSGGTEFVSGDGVAINNTIGGHDGTVYANSVGAITDDQNIYSGGTDSGSIIVAGAIENVYSGGNAFGDVISSAGVMNVFFSGTVSGSLVADGGFQNVDSGGT